MQDAKKVIELSTVAHRNIMFFWNVRQFNLGLYPKS